MSVTLTGVPQAKTYREPRQQMLRESPRVLTMITRFHRTAVIARTARVAGFTLLELLTVIGIVGILTAVGIPSYRYVIDSSRMAAEVNSLLGDLQFARAEAIKEGQTVTACVSADNATCAGNAAWNTGWIGVLGREHECARRCRRSPCCECRRRSWAPIHFSRATASRAVTFNREGFANRNSERHVDHAARRNGLDDSNTRCLAITLVGLMTTQLYGATTNGFTCS